MRCGQSFLETGSSGSAQLAEANPRVFGAPLPLLASSSPGGIEAASSEKDERPDWKYGALLLNPVCSLQAMQHLGSCKVSCGQSPDSSYLQTSLCWRLFNQAELCRGGSKNAQEMCLDPQVLVSDSQTRLHLLISHVSFAFYSLIF